MISVFTPSHDTTYLGECYASLLAQGYEDWEWIVVLNGGAKWTKPRDKRVRVVTRDKTNGFIGALKAEACKLAKGDILVELDHDDYLSPIALANIEHIFGSGGESVGLVYSDTIQINADGSPNHDRFAEGFGWTYRMEGEYQVIEAKPPTPHNVSYIWYAPNHVRAFRKSTYDEVGGYNEKLDICDDAELMCRLFKVSQFVHSANALYYQRVHDDNTQKDPEKNARIQNTTVALYDEHIQPNALAWTQRGGWPALDLGGAHNSPIGYAPIDRELSGLDVFKELAQFPDNSVGVIRAVDFIEHIEDSVALFNEIHRILVPNGMFLSMTPSTDGRGAFCDPTHVSFFNELSFRYYCDDEFRKYVPAIRAKFTMSRLATIYLSEWHEQNNVPYVCANLVKNA